MAAKTAKKRTAERRRRKTLRSSPAYRAEVARAVERGNSVADVAQGYGIAQGTVRAWVKRHGTTLDADPVALPTEPAKSASRRKALPLKATAYACPHCGGPIAAE